MTAITFYCELLTAQRCYWTTTNFAVRSGSPILVFEIKWKEFEVFTCIGFLYNNWAAFRQNRQKYDLCAQRRLGSAWISTQSDQRLRYSREEAVLSYPWGTQWRLWSGWADVQADLSLRCAHMSFCWSCRAQAEMTELNCSNFIFVLHSIFIFLLQEKCIQLRV